MLRPWLCRFFYLNVFFCLVFSKPMSPLFTRREYITFQSLSANTAQLFLPKLQVIMETCCNFFDLLESQNIFSTKPGLKAWLLMDQAASSALSSFWWCFLTIFFLLKKSLFKSEATWAAVSWVLLKCMELLKSDDTDNVYNYSPITFQYKPSFMLSKHHMPNFLW